MCIRDRWDTDALDVDAIVEGVTGANGHLGTRHTRRWLRRVQAAEDLSYRGGDDEWAAAGRPDVVDRARARVAELVALPPVGLSADVEAELCRLVDEAAQL